LWDLKVFSFGAAFAPIDDVIDSNILDRNDCGRNTSCTQQEISEGIFQIRIFASQLFSVPSSRQITCPESASGALVPIPELARRTHPKLHQEA
jgi:hypothetical protein